MIDAGVRSVLITPVVADFANAEGPPIVIDRQAQTAYGLSSSDTVFVIGGGLSIGLAINIPNLATF